MRVLDLGCGCGHHAAAGGKVRGHRIRADLWISPTENYQRFRSLGIDDKAIPVHVDEAVLFSVDAYHYFGDSAEMLPSLVPFVKRGGYIAVAVPGLKYEFGKDVPAEMQLFGTARWKGPCTRWAGGKACGRAQEGIELAVAWEMDCCAKAWEEWLASGHPIAAEDADMMEAEGGKYNLVQLIAKVV